MSTPSRFRWYLLASIGVVIIALAGATAWLLEPAWKAYREQMAFEQAVQKSRFEDDATLATLSKLARQSGLPQFAATEVDKNGAVLVPFYLRASWYCLYRDPIASQPDRDPSAATASRTTRVYRLDIPQENYWPQTEDARKLVARVGQVDVRNTPSGPVEEPALPLHDEDTRRVAFMWDFYELLTGRAGDHEVRIGHKLIRVDPPGGQ